MKWIFTFFMITITSTLMAQVKWGVRAGGNLVKIASIDQSEEFDFFEGLQYRASYHVGLLTRIPTGGKFQSQLELLYAERGVSQENIASSGSSSDLNYHLRYISMPFMIIYNPIASLHLELGPEIAYRITTDAKLDGESIDPPLFNDKDVDISLIGGVSYDLAESFNVSFRYIHGFVNVDQIDLTTELGDSLGEINFRNRSLQLSVAYFFGSSEKK